jgi:uncharacterized membrane protein (UPF0127 family)
VLHNAFKLFKRYKNRPIKIKGRKYNLWIADTPIKRRKGLSQVRELPRGWGMFFWFAQDVNDGFTMENTSIPLTIIFLDKNYDIVDTFKCRPGQKGTIKPKTKYRYVIEI